MAVCSDPQPVNEPFVYTAIQSALEHDTDIKVADGSLGANVIIVEVEL
jgi:hypothetical protein